MVIPSPWARNRECPVLHSRCRVGYSTGIETLRSTGRTGEAGRGPVYGKSMSAIRIDGELTELFRIRGLGRDVDVARHTQCNTGNSGETCKEGGKLYRCKTKWQKCAWTISVSLMTLSCWRTDRRACRI